MTPEDKARIEEIRELLSDDNCDDKCVVHFLLAQLDEAHELQKKLIQNWNHTTENLLALEKKYEVAHATLRDIRDNYDCDSDAHKYGTPCRCCTARKALDGSTDPDTGTKGSLGEE